MIIIEAKAKAILLVVCFLVLVEYFQMCIGTVFIVDVAFGPVSFTSLKQAYQVFLYFVLSQAVVTVEEKFYDEWFVNGKLLLTWKS